MNALGCLRVMVALDDTDEARIRLREHDAVESAEKRPRAAAPKAHRTFALTAGDVDPKVPDAKLDTRGIGA